MEIKCGLANQNDIAAIAEICYQVSKLHTDSVPREFTEPDKNGNLDYIARSIAAENSEVIKAEIAGLIAGYLVLYFDTYPEKYFVDSRRGFVGSIGVEEKFRGQGVGTALMKYAEQFLRDKNIKVFNIDVYSFNSGAEKLYDKLGFEDIKHFKRKILE